MDFTGKTIGFAITGSHCTIAQVLPIMKCLIESGAKLVPILSEAVQSTDTRFGRASDWRLRVIEITGREPFTTIPEAEPLGPKKLLDALIIAPCTGNTLAKIAGAVTDTVVTMAAKAHLRNGRPVILALSTNDGLGANASNLGLLLNRKNIYMVPFGQDNPLEKQNSLIADMTLIPETVQSALEGRQIQPMLVMCRTDA